MPRGAAKSPGVRLPSIVSVLASAPGDTFTLSSCRVSLRDVPQGTTAFINNDRATEEHALPIIITALPDMLPGARQTRGTSSKPNRALCTRGPNLCEAQDASRAPTSHPYPYLAWTPLQDGPSRPITLARTVPQCQRLAASENPGRQVGRHVFVPTAAGPSDAHAVLFSLRCPSNDRTADRREAVLPSTIPPPQWAGQAYPKMAEVDRFSSSPSVGRQVGDIAVDYDGKDPHEHHELAVIVDSISGRERNLRQGSSTRSGWQRRAPPNIRSDAVLSSRYGPGQPASSFQFYTLGGQISTLQARQDANDAWRTSQRSGRSILKIKRAGEPSSCLACDCVATAEWRSGPTGPRTFCNACGLQYAKRARCEKPSARSSVGDLEDILEDLRRERGHNKLRQQIRPRA